MGEQNYMEDENVVSRVKREGDKLVANGSMSDLKASRQIFVA